MQAARIHRYGEPDVLEIVETHPSPIESNDVRVSVAAASVNPVDCKIRSGGQRLVIPYRLPWTLGLDFAGTIIEIGKRVTQFKVGDHVYGSPTHRRQGTYAQDLVVSADEIARAPKNLSLLEAASLPLVALTSWDALVIKGRLKRGQKALIHAGSGGVGSFAIQLAKALGAEVSTTCSAKNHPLVRALGADHAIDYRNVAFDEVLEGFDFVLDALGGETRDRSFRILKRGGVLATMVGGIPASVHQYGPVLGTTRAVLHLAELTARGPIRYGVRVEHVLRKSCGRQLSRITELVESNAIKPVIDRTYPLAEIVEAHAYSEQGRARGKIVIAMP